MARDVLVVVVLGGVLAAACAGRLMVGEPVPLAADGAVDAALWEAILRERQWRIVLGVVVGAGLAVSGALLQALLRNPLASPYILGVSSGAAVGVMCAWAGWLAALADWLAARGAGGLTTPTAAFAGAGATLLLVYLLSQRRGWIDPLGLLLVGVIINSINGAAIMFIHHLAPQGHRSDIFVWMMGYLDSGVSAMTLTAVGVVVLIGWLMGAALGPAMDIASLSDAEAHSIGLNLPRLRLVLFALAGLLTSVTVVLAGPIGFVGLIGPHLVRLLIGPRHRPLLLGSALAGAALVVGADAAIKAFDAHVHPIGLLPIGAVTALIGGPLFILMLRPQLGRRPGS